MQRLAVIAVSIAMGVSCGGSDDTDDVTPTLDDQSSNDIAHRYAIEKSGGVATYCSETSDGPEAETDPGCIYEVTFAGCLEGMLGIEVGSISVEERFAQSPALLGLYRDAAVDCRL